MKRVHTFHKRDDAKLPAAMVAQLDQEVRRSLQTVDLKQRFERESRAQAYVFNVFGWLAEAARS